MEQDEYHKIKHVSLCQTDRQHNYVPYLCLLHMFTFSENQNIMTTFLKTISIDHGGALRCNRMHNLMTTV